MENKIKHIYPSVLPQTFNNTEVYVADFSERTNSARGVEFHPSHPFCPKTEGQLMDCLLIKNPQRIALSFIPFENNLFKDEQGNERRQTILTFKNSDGTAFSANAGNSYICLIDTAMEVVID